MSSGAVPLPLKFGSAWTVLCLLWVSGAVEMHAQDGNSDLSIHRSVTWLSIPFGTRPCLNQGNLVHGENACGPTSLLNLLLLGPAPYRAIFSELPGTSDQDKFDALLKTFGNDKSAAWQGDAIFKVDATGIQIWDELKLANSLLALHHLDPLEFLDLQGHTNEDARTFLLRFHRSVLDSLHTGIPLLANLAWNAFNRDEKHPGWDSVHGHYILICAVEETVRNFQLGFSIQYMDPGLGMQEAFVHCEPSKDPAFLLVEGPSFPSDIIQPPLGGDTRRCISLMSVIGRFPTTMIKLWAWEPKDVSEQWKTVDIALNRTLLTTPKMLCDFEYSGGQHRLDISSLALLVDGVQVSRDEHQGRTGANNFENEYVLDTHQVPATGTLSLRAEIRSDGGVDSHGKLYLANQVH